MQQINKNTACYTCLGCNKLELESFKGVYECKDKIKGVTYEQRGSNKNIKRAY